MTTKKYRLRIYTNSYVGNFERELTSYVFGYYNEDSDQRVFELYEDQTGERGEKLTESLSEFYDEHGHTCCEIDSDSNNLNVYFDEDPRKFMDIIDSRIDSFKEYWKSVYKFYDKNLIIINISFFEIITTEREIII